MTADPGAYMPRAATERALGELERAVAKGDAPVLLLGPPGIGKTLLLRVAERRFSGRFHSVYVAYSALSAPELCAWILGLLGEPAPPDGDTEEAILATARRLAALGTPLVLLLDDASATPGEAAERIRALAAGSRGTLRLVAAGIGNGSGEDWAKHFGSRAVRVTLDAAMTLAETAMFVRARLERAGIPARERSRFDGEVLERIFRRSGGIPRAVHAYAGEFLRIGEAALPANPLESAFDEDDAASALVRVRAAAAVRGADGASSPALGSALLTSTAARTDLLHDDPADPLAGRPAAPTPMRVERSTPATSAVAYEPPPAAQTAPADLGRVLPPPRAPTPETKPPAPLPAARTEELPPVVRTETPRPAPSTEPLPPAASMEPAPPVTRTEALPVAATTEPPPPVTRTEAQPVAATTEPLPPVTRTEAQPVAATAEPAPLVARTDAPPPAATAAQTEPLRADLLPPPPVPLDPLTPPWEAAALRAAAPTPVAKPAVPPPTVVKPEPAPPPPAASAPLPPAARVTPPARAAASSLARATRRAGAGLRWQEALLGLLGLAAIAIAVPLIFDVAVTQTPTGDAAPAPPESPTAAPSTAPAPTSDVPALAPPTAPPATAAPTPAPAAAPPPQASATLAPPAPLPAAAPAPIAPAPQPRPPTPERTARETPRAPAPAAAPARPAPAIVSVNINATPWAQVEVDGVDRGETPIAGVRLSEGEHRFRARMPDGRVVERTVRIAPDRRHVTFE